METHTYTVSLSSRPCLVDFDPFREKKERSYAESSKDMSTIGQQLLEGIDKRSNKETIRKNMFNNFLLVSYSV